MPALKAGDTETANTSAPTVPGLSPETVRHITATMQRHMRRGGAVGGIITAFMDELDGGAILLTLHASGELTWARGARPPFIEKIRSVEEILATKVIKT